MAVAAAQAVADASLIDRAEALYRGGNTDEGIAARDAGEADVIPEMGGSGRVRSRRRTAEDRIFDKAELAAGVDKLRARAQQVADGIEELRSQANGAEPEGRPALDRRIESEERRLTAMEHRIEHLLGMLDGE